MRNGLLAALTVALGLTVAVGGAHAATLNPSQVGTSSACASTKWHFVNNQTGGAAAGTLTATFSTGTFTVGATTVLSNTQHFYVTTTGSATLLGAATNLPGRLLLSDVSCVTPPPEECDPKLDPECPPPPPPCDPKLDPKCV